MRLIDVQDTALDPEYSNREIATNLSGTNRMVHQFLLHLIIKKSAAIVTISSGIAFLTYSSTPFTGLQKQEGEERVLPVCLQAVNASVDAKAFINSFALMDGLFSADVADK